MKKFLLAALTASTLALGLSAASAPAQAQIFFGFGGPGYYGYHHYGYYHHRRYLCNWVNVRRHHHWVTVRRCGWFW